MKAKNILKNKKVSYFTIISGPVLVAIFLYFVFFINANIDSLINSDDASELILGKLLSVENKLLSSNWYYGYELKVLHAQIFYALFFKLFDSWHTVRIASYICLYIIMLVSYFFMCKKYKCEDYFAVTATILMIPFSDLYFDLVLCAVHYIPHIAIAFTILGFSESFVNATSKKFSWLISGMTLSLISCLGGPRQIIVLYIPLVLSSVCIALANLEEKQGIINLNICKENKRYILYFLSR